jgi:hypothetical protein
MNVSCLCVCVFLYLCICWSPAQGVLPNVLRSSKPKWNGEFHGGGPRTKIGAVAPKKKKCNFQTCFITLFLKEIRLTISWHRNFRSCGRILVRKSQYDATDVKLCVSQITTVSNEPAASIFGAKKASTLKTEAIDFSEMSVPNLTTRRHTHTRWPPQTSPSFVIGVRGACHWQRTN